MPKDPLLDCLWDFFHMDRVVEHDIHRSMPTTALYLSRLRVPRGLSEGHPPPYKQPFGRRFHGTDSTYIRCGEYLAWPT